MKRIGLSLCLFMFCGSTPQAWATAPVVDLSIDGASSSSSEQDEQQESIHIPGQLHVEVASKEASQTKTHPRTEAFAFSEEQGGATDDAYLLKQQIANYMRLNLPAKIEALEQEIAELRGQLEVQSHALKSLKDQQQYYDQASSHHKEQKNTAEEPLPKEDTADHSDESKITASKKTVVVAPNKVTSVEAEQQAYNKAFNLIKEKKYSQAIEKLKEFLKEYADKDEGDSKYALNAYYWLGELYFLQGQFELASDQFKAVIKKFPGKPKVPDAMLKLGLISAHLGKNAEAKQMFQSIKKRYPDSAAAHSAILELQKISPE